MSSEENQGKTPNSSGTIFPVDAKDDELSEKVGDDVVRPISEEDGSDNLKDDEAASSMTSSYAAQIVTLLQNLQLHNEIQRERLIALMQLYDPTAEDRNAIVNTEGEQIATETELSSEVHILEQSVEKLQEEVEKQKKANAELEDQINCLTKSSDP